MCGTLRSWKWGRVSLFYPGAAWYEQDEQRWIVDRHGMLHAGACIACGVAVPHLSSFPFPFFPSFLALIFAQPSQRPRTADSPTDATDSHHQKNDALALGSLIATAVATPLTSLALRSYVGIPS